APPTVNRVLVRRLRAALRRPDAISAWAAGESKDALRELSNCPCASPARARTDRATSGMRRYIWAAAAAVKARPRRRSLSRGARPAGGGISEKSHTGVCQGRLEARCSPARGIGNIMRGLHARGKSAE